MLSKHCKNAGVVQWQNPSLPSWLRGSDSLHPLQTKHPFGCFFFALLGNLCSNLVAFALRLNSLFLTESRLRFFVHWTRLTPFPSPAPSENYRAYGSIFCFTKNAALYRSQFSLYRPNAKLALQFRSVLSCEVSAAKIFFVKKISSD